MIVPALVIVVRAPPKVLVVMSRVPPAVVVNVPPTVKFPPAVLVPLVLSNNKLLYVPVTTV